MVIECPLAAISSRLSLGLATIAILLIACLKWNVDNAELEIFLFVIVVKDQKVNAKMEWLDPAHIDLIVPNSDFVVL